MLCYKQKKKYNKIIKLISIKNAYRKFFTNKQNFDFQVGGIQ